MPQRDESTGDTSADGAAESVGDVGAASPPRPARMLRTSSIAWGMALGGVVGIVLTVLALVYFFRGEGTPLTVEALQEAETRWAQHGPPSYNVDLALVGSQPGQIQVEVRDGEVTRMVRNGHQPSQRRTWYYWSVPGQFETITIDFEAAKQPAEGFGVASGTQVVMRAEFDPQFGYPRFYQRILLGTGIHVEWQVTRFEVVSE